MVYCNVSKINNFGFGKFSVVDNNMYNDWFFEYNVYYVRVEGVCRMLGL